ncbi:Oidioi.mRNA.OKI2018_I69.PAR.g10962.t2.cds [Oikopleura dioica]|uniref:Oidioi.mRNA.OKI2018_I69.PAR.g10962.t2.cds n=1 Tax=Oikopleura dioica TaxID=34765 RepID=A0ABN7RTD6_OIKDI|nr:Oidioi.mRNA.OKI2018_I69.PAR.g10962.t2.cds [Oikopleura dioica]
MEPEVVEDDFQRFQKENHDKWKLIDESLEKCLEIDGQGESVSFQLNRLKHLLTKVSKFEDFRFHWSSLRNCYENGQRIKKKDSSTDPMEELLSPNSISKDSNSTSSDVSAQECSADNNEEKIKSDDTIEIDTNNTNENSNGAASLMEIFGKAGFPNGIPGLPVQALNGQIQNPIQALFAGQNRPSLSELVSTTSSILRENSMNSLNIAKAMAPEQNVPETVLKVCTHCGKGFDDELQLLEHVQKEVQCQEKLRMIGLRFCLVCRKPYDNIRKCKTHYTNYRNSSVNPREKSRFLHRILADIIRFPSAKDLEDYGPRMPLTPDSLGQKEIQLPQIPQKCRACDQTCSSHSDLLGHLVMTENCLAQYKIIGKLYCFVCDKSFEHEKQAETHYRNSLYSGHQQNRSIHKQYFDLIRERKTPGKRISKLPANLSDYSMDFFSGNQSATVSTSNSPPQNNPISMTPLFDPSSASTLPVPKPINELMCLICKEKFPSEEARFAHLSDPTVACHTETPLTFKTVCILCIKDCETEQKLSAHLRLHRNEWHQKYYELFYRKRPGKKRRLSDDIDMHSASLSQFISQNYANETNLIPNSSSSMPNPLQLPNSLFNTNVAKTEPLSEFPTLLEFSGHSPMQTLPPVSSTPLSPGLKTEPGVQLNA